jgi:hypothetical protein
MAHATLFEELLLLYAYGHPKGISNKAVGIRFDLGAAVLAELALEDRIRAELADPNGLSGKYHPSKDFLTVTDPTPLGDPEADVVLEHLQTTSYPSPYQWILNATQSVWSPGDSSTLAQRLVDRLTEERSLHAHSHKTLGLFPSRRFVLANRGTAASVRNDLEQLLHGTRPDARTATLALLVFAPYASIASLGHAEGSNRNTKELWHTLKDGDWGSASQRQTIGSIVSGVEALAR